MEHNIIITLYATYKSNIILSDQYRLLSADDIPARLSAASESSNVHAKS